MLTHEQLVKKMLKNPAVQAEYDAQAEELPCWTNCCVSGGAPA